jgi:hypothetical protein
MGNDHPPTDVPAACINARSQLGAPTNQSPARRDTEQTKRLGFLLISEAAHPDVELGGRKAAERDTPIPPASS